MLYERWRSVAQAQSRAIAVQDLRRNERWTFQQLADAAEQSQPPEGSAVYPSGTGARFVLTVLEGWRHRKLVCPLDTGQSPPHLDPLPGPAIAHLKTTSASTGAPRLVAFTGAQLAADAEQIVATMGLRADWPNVGVISLAHSYGFSNLVLPLLLHGIPLYLTGTALPEGVRRLLVETGPVTLPAVPALWRAWLEAGAIHPNINLAISAGAPLPLALEQEVFEKTRVKIHNFYGATECGGIAFDAGAGPRTDTQEAGTALQGVELSIGRNGCLLVRSRAAGQNYWPEPTDSLRDGAFQTSDLAEFRGGQLYLCGRFTDQINVAGRKVSPEEIERALLAHPQVRQCLVFGVPSADARGEQIVACVARRDSPAAEALRQFLLERLPSWQVPRDWWWVEELDTNARGKLSRAEFRRRYLEEKPLRNTPDL